VVLYVDTDAPLPPPPGERLLPDEPAPLFDRLTIDLFPPGVSEPCRGCSREFELDRESVKQGRVSIAVTPEPGQAGHVARVRLFRGATAQSGRPPELSTIESSIALPVVGEEGLIEVTALLLVDDVGYPQGSLAEPLEPQYGRPAPSRVGTWPKAQRVPCRSAPRDDEACVPGGAFWMGNPTLQLSEDGSDKRRTRLVVLSPFFMSLHETTVAELRASGLAIVENGHAVEPPEGARANPQRAAESMPVFSVYDAQYFCNYTATAGPDDAELEAVPITCANWDTARFYCAGRGGDLPTEAQYEYVAGALSSQTYVWGSERADLSCNDAVWDRSGVGYFYDGIGGHCRAEGDMGGPMRPGSGRLDRLRLGEREIVDLAANLAEWTLDDWNRPSEPCWQGEPLTENPLCVGVGVDGDLRTVKGGSWAGPPDPAAEAVGRAPDGKGPTLGFRCTRSAN
jgi:formylglycine-generating enzyme required for sulfatase activity